MCGVDWKGWRVNVLRSEPQPRRAGRWADVFSWVFREADTKRRFGAYVEEILRKRTGRRHGRLGELRDEDASLTLKETDKKVGAEASYGEQ